MLEWRGSISSHLYHYQLKRSQPFTAAHCSGGPSVLREMLRVLSIEIQRADTVSWYLCKALPLTLRFLVKLVKTVI